VGLKLSKQREKPNWIKQNLIFLSTIVLASSAINSLFSHSGKTILFSFPNSWPLIGGIITAESLVYGAINGLIISALFLLFNVLNLALSIKQLTHLIPRAFYPIAMIVTISLTFFPSINQRIREIKEAQMIRGNPMKKFSDWLPILAPLLVSSLEKGLILSESMTSRGFYTFKPSHKTIFPVITMIIGSFSIFSGWILSLYSYSTYIYLPIYISGVTIIFLTLNRLSKAVKTTRYHQEMLTKHDMLAIVIIIFVILFLGLVSISGNLTSLNYTPYPSLVFPNFELAPMLIALLTLLPVMLNHHDKI
jgi:energy-coupling factor transport system permease protein